MLSVSKAVRASRANALFRERVVEPRRNELREVLEHVRERAELREGADVEAAVNMLIGSYYAQHLAGDPFPDDWPEAVVRTILVGLNKSGQ